MTMPPLPGTSWLPTIAPSSATHLPPLLFLLAPLCPVFADTFHPVKSLPLKIFSNPASSNFSGFGGSARATAKSAARPVVRRKAVPRMGRLLGGDPGLLPGWGGDADADEHAGEERSFGVRQRGPHPDGAGVGIDRAIHSPELRRIRETFVAGESDGHG